MAARIGGSLIPRNVLGVATWVAARPRLMMWLHIAVILYVLMVAWAPPALAGPQNPLGGLDRKDSAGYALSNYSIAYQVDGFGIGPAFTAMFGALTSLVWEGYRWAVGVASLLVDFTFTFKWVDWLAYPVEQVAQRLDTLLDQVPAVRELLIALAVGIGLTRMYFGQGAKGLTEVLFSLIAWGVTAAIAVNPVTWLVGDDSVLGRTKLAGQTLVAQLLDPDASIDSSDPSASSGKLAASMVDMFVRKPHQFVAYGALADGGGCEKTYNENLTKSADDLAKAMASCSPDFAETIQHPGPLTLVTMLIVLAGGLILVAIAALLAGFALLEVTNMLLGGLRLVWEFFVAVGPGGSWKGALAVLLDIGGSILWLLFAIMANVLYLSIAQYVFEQSQDDVIVVFLVVDLVLVVGIIALLTQHRKLQRKIDQLKKRMAQRSSKTRPGPVTLSPRAVRAAALGAVAARPVGSKLAHAGSAVGGAGRRLGARGLGAATAPVRAATRGLSRPGALSAALVSRATGRAGGGIVARRSARALAYKAGESKWRRREAVRQEKARKRELARERGKHWTWAGGQRAVDAKNTPQKETATTGSHRIPRRRPDTAPARPHQRPQHAPTPAPASGETNARQATSRPEPRPTPPKESRPKPTSRRTTPTATRRTPSGSQQSADSSSSPATRLRTRLQDHQQPRRAPQQPAARTQTTRGSTKPASSKSGKNRNRRRK